MLISSYKRILLILLILMIIGMYYIKIYQDQMFIEMCIKVCVEDLYHYMIQEDSKLYFGHSRICIGKEELHLLTTFYTDYIINKVYITTFLENLNWKEIININQESIINIKEYVREIYVDYIRKQENMYILELLINTNIEELKEKILQAYYDNLNITPGEKEKIISNIVIWNILETIDLRLYITTTECQDQTFSTLINIFYDQIKTIISLKNMINEDIYEQRRLLIQSYMDPIIRYINALVLKQFINFYDILLAKKSIILISKNIPPKDAYYKAILFIINYIIKISNDIIK